MPDKRYYKIISKETGDDELYATCNLPLSPQDFLELLGISGAYGAEEISSEEYYANVDEDE